MPKVREQSALKMTAEILQDIWKAQALYDAGDWDACEPVIRRPRRAGSGGAVSSRNSSTQSSG